MPRVQVSPVCPSSEHYWVSSRAVVRYNPLNPMSRSSSGLTICLVAPILVLIIAMWYKKEEQGRRVSWFYVCNSLTQIFGGFVAYGVSHANTRFATWRIFYIAIGALTIAVGLLVAIFLPDSPVKAVRFTDAEKVAALLRVKNNQRYVLTLATLVSYPPSSPTPSLYQTYFHTACETP